MEKHSNNCEKLEKKVEELIAQQRITREHLVVVVGAVQWGLWICFAVYLISTSEARYMDNSLAILFIIGALTLLFVIPFHIFSWMWHYFDVGWE